MTRPTRILYLATTLAVGGAERSLLELLDRFDRSRFEPLVCTLIAGGALVRDLRASGIEVVELGVAAGAAELFGLRLLPLLLRFRPDIVHSRLILSNLWARFGRMTGARVINEERGLALDRPHWMTVVNRWTDRLVDVHVANSQAVATQMQVRDRIAPARIRVIYGGVDTARFAPAGDGAAKEIDIVSVTRIERYKGVFDLLEAVALLVPERPSLRCVIVGDGSERSALERRCRELRLESVVSMVGYRTDVNDLLRASRIFVLPSHEEGLPNAVMEAMACGLPVVATAVGGTTELVVDRSTGRLTPVRDPDQLAKGLRSYLADDSLARSDGAAGCLRARQRFSVQRSVADYTSLYDELVVRAH